MRSGFPLLTLKRHRSETNRRRQLNNLRRCFRIWSPRNEDTADALQHRLASLVAQVDLVAKNSHVRFRLRFAPFQIGNFEIEVVSWAYWVRQLQFVIPHSRKDMDLRL